MATDNAKQAPAEKEHIRRVKLGTFRLSWGAILGGAFLAIGLMILLHLLGLAIGLTAVDQSPGGAGIWIAVWALIVPILAIFLGGLLSGRAAGATNRRGGAMNGLVVWGFSTFVGIILFASAITSVIGTAASVGGTVASAVGSALGAVGNINFSQAGRALGVTAQDLLQPINQARAARGLPPLTVGQLQAALQDAVNTSLQEGRVNREILVGALADNTAVSRDTAEQIAGRVEQQVSQIGAGVASAADTALDTLAWYTWFGFISSLLSLLAGLLGGALGVSRAQRRTMVEARERAPFVTGQPTEVCP